MLRFATLCGMMGVMGFGTVAGCAGVVPDADALDGARTPIPVDATRDESEQEATLESAEDQEPASDLEPQEEAVLFVSSRDTWVRTVEDDAPCLLGRGRTLELSSEANGEVRFFAGDYFIGFGGWSDCGLSELVAPRETFDAMITEHYLRVGYVFPVAEPREVSASLTGGTCTVAEHGLLEVEHIGDLDDITVSYTGPSATPSDCLDGTTFQTSIEILEDALASYTSGVRAGNEYPVPRAERIDVWSVTDTQCFLKAGLRVRVTEVNAQFVAARVIRREGDTANGTQCTEAQTLLFPRETAFESLRESFELESKRRAVLRALNRDIEAAIEAPTEEYRTRCDDARATEIAPFTLESHPTCDPTRATVARIGISVDGLHDICQVVHQNGSRCNAGQIFVAPMVHYAREY